MTTEFSATTNNPALAPIPLLQDRLTGFPLTQGWLLALPDGRFPSNGVLFWMHIGGIASSKEHISADDADLYLREISRRFQQALPATATFMRGAEASLAAWLPEVSEDMLPIHRKRVLDAVSSTPISVSTGEQVKPRIALQALPMSQGRQAHDIIVKLEHHGSPQSPAAFVSPATGTELLAEQLQARLDSARFFGQAGTVEAIFARLDLPALRPETVVLVGPEQSGKARLLNSLLQLVDGQHTPVLEVLCRPWHQEVPYWLLVSLIRGLLTFYSAQAIEQQFPKIRQHYPWLGRLFLVLANETPALLPDDPQQLREGLEMLLMEMVRRQPHIAVIHDFHFADQESLVTLSAMQCAAGHGLRILADVAQSNSQAVLHHLSKHNACVMMLQPLTPEEVQAYLAQALPDIARPEVAVLLHEHTGGLRVAIERKLMHWLKAGVLTYTDEHWVFQQHHTVAQQPAIDDAQSAQQEAGGSKKMRSLLLGGAVLLMLACCAIVAAIAFSRQHSPAAPRIVASKINKADSAEMLFIPAGDFQQGISPAEAAALQRRHADWGVAQSAAQITAHTQHLYGFWIYRYEVTVAQYRQFCWQTGRPEPSGTNDMPITRIAWQEASEYCRWAGGRLPTESEWEYAARGHDGRRYPWGNNWDTRWPVAVNSAMEHAAPAGSQALDVSPFGVHDMAGNVAEWCADRFDARPGVRALRGGSFHGKTPDDFNVALRYPLAEDAQRDDVGFRCVIP